MRNTRSNDLSACLAGAGWLLAGNLPPPASTSGHYADDATQRWEAEALSSLQDTFETSMCTNQLFPTVDCPEDS